MFQKLNDLKKSKSKQQSEQPPPPPQAGSGVPESPNPFNSFGASGQIVEEEGMSIPTGTPDRKEVSLYNLLHVVLLMIMNYIGLHT